MCFSYEVGVVNETECCGLTFVPEIGREMTQGSLVSLVEEKKEDIQMLTVFSMMLVMREVLREGNSAEEKVEVVEKVLRRLESPMVKSRCYWLVIQY